MKLLKHIKKEIIQNESIKPNRLIVELLQFSIFFFISVFAVLRKTTDRKEYHLKWWEENSVDFLKLSSNN